MILVFASLLLPGVARATSIFTPVSLEKETISKFTAPITKDLAQPRLALINQQISLNTAFAGSAHRQETVVCEAGCYQSIEVPEPQSWVLVGSGLLSMAGLFRRKVGKQINSFRSRGVR